MHILLIDSNEVAPVRQKLTNSMYLPGQDSGALPDSAGKSYGYGCSFMGDGYQVCMMIKPSLELVHLMLTVVTSRWILHTAMVENARFVLAGKPALSFRIHILNVSTTIYPIFSQRPSQ